MALFSPILTHADIIYVQPDNIIATSTLSNDNYELVGSFNLPVNTSFGSGSGMNVGSVSFGGGFGCVGSTNCRTGNIIIATSSSVTGSRMIPVDQIASANLNYGIRDNLDTFSTEFGTTTSPVLAGTTLYIFLATNSGDTPFSFYLDTTRSNIYGAIVSDYTPFPDLTTTRIISVTPPDNYTTGTSSTITVGALINVNARQWSDALAANNGNWFVQMTLYPKNTLPSIPSAAGAFDAAVNSKVIIFPITTSGTSNFSTTTVLATEGPTTYTMTTQIIQPNPFATVLQWFGFGSARVLDTKTTSFINGSPSGFDTLVGSTTDIIGQFFASSSPALIASCASFTGFNLGDCLNLLFIPQSGDLARVLNDMNTGLFTFVPWGYVTRTINILGGQATSSFPLIAVGIPNPQNPHEYMMFHFDPNEMIAGAAALNNSIVDPVSEEPVMPGIKQIVDTVLALSVITFIFYDLVGGKKSGAVHKTKLS